MIHFSDNHAAGYLPTFLNEHDPDDAVTQLDKHYAHGGGWRDFEGFTLLQDNAGEYVIEYPGDPAFHEVSRGTLRDETIVLFPYGWVAVITPGKGHRIARMD